VLSMTMLNPYTIGLSTGGPGVYSPQLSCRRLSQAKRSYPSVASKWEVQGKCLHFL
jgi:hypothetical protein